MFAVRRSLLLVYLFTTAARVSLGAWYANAGGCELSFLAAEPARIAAALCTQASRLLGELLLEARLTVILITGLRRFFGLARAAAKRNCYDHLFVWENRSPSTTLGDLRTH